MKILLVGGTFDKDGGRESGLITKMSGIMMAQYEVCVHSYNGGYYKKLEDLLDIAKEYDVVFWMANVPNDYPKIRNVKNVAPYTLLVTSKRNDGDKYSFQELINHALGLKSNMTIEFKKENSVFHIRVFDPLGVLWYEGTDLEDLITTTIHRLRLLSSITRQGTHPAKEKPTTPDQQDFIALTKVYAEKFHELISPVKEVTRFLGNASFRIGSDSTNFRCTKGFPSFRADKYIFVSQRNVDKKSIAAENFVPAYLENDKVYYCGENKPSVDTPVQLRLYGQLPNINYMIHAHCYIESAPFTKIPIPCGALQEVSEILQTIQRNYPSMAEDFYVINLIGHGSICMSKTVKNIAGIKYKGREMPENIVYKIDYSNFQTDSDILDYADETGISLTVLYDEFDRRQTLGTPCEGCKHVAFRTNMYPCNMCSRIYRDMYEKK